MCILLGYKRFEIVDDDYLLSQIEFCINKNGQEQRVPIEFPEIFES